MKPARMETRKRLKLNHLTVLWRRRPVSGLTTREDDGEDGVSQGPHHCRTNLDRKASLSSVACRAVLWQVRGHFWHFDLKQAAQQQHDIVRVEAANPVPVRGVGWVDVGPVSHPAQPGRPPQPT